MAEQGEATKAGPTPASVQATVDWLNSWLDQAQVHTEGLIEDYPIGRERGKCVLRVESKSGKGWRSVRQTTDKNGKWCKPKTSVYHDGLIVVVSHPDMARQFAWLNFSQGAVWLCYANGEQRVLAKAPCSSKPRRTPSTYKLVHHVMFSAEPAKEETHTLPADPPELCDAWDVWEKNLLLAARKMRERLIKAIAAATK